MALSERSRQEMYQAFEQKVGKEAALTLLEHLPPIGWADVATNQSLELLEARLNAKLEQKLRETVFALIAAQIAIFGLFAALLKLT